MPTNYNNIDRGFFGYDHKYIISYRGLQGEELCTQLKANNKDHAEMKFKRKFNGLCKVVNIQTIGEWVDETSTDIVSNLMKNINEEDLFHLFEKE